MSLADQLKAVALRKTKNRETEHEQQDASSKALIDELKRESDQNARLRACDLEAWYDALVEHTFRTEFVAFTPREAEALIAIYWSKVKAEKALADSSVTGVACRPTVAVTMDVSEAQEILDGLAKRIDTALQALDPGDERGVFAKLSSRSPKDSRFCEARALEAIKSEISNARASSSSSHKQLDAETIFKIVMKHGVASLRLRGSQEIIEAFTTSDRVCEDDLVLALSFRKKVWSQHVVLREWIEIPNFCELRGFVVGGELTALSQYFVGVSFPELVAHKERMLSLVRASFDEVAEKIPMEPKEYVVDFAVDLDANRVYVIELNPFGPPHGLGTGTALFDLKGSEHDRKVLFGELPFEFRIECASENPNRDDEGDVSAQSKLQNLLSDGPLKKWLVDEGIVTL